MAIPPLVARVNKHAGQRFVEFFTAEIRNPHTRRAYARAVRDFCRRCEERGIALECVNPVSVAAFIKQLGQRTARPTMKQALSAIRMLCDYLVLGHALEVSPASRVRGPKHVVKKGKTPVLTPEETRQLFDAIDLRTICGLRDRALIEVMVFSFARVGAVVGMNVDDFYQNEKRFWLRLHEKGGKHHEVPAHHKAEEFSGSVPERIRHR